MTPRHVLVVDDDPSILELIVRALASQAVRVSTARRVSIARDVLTRQSVDLVVTDARMPGETGLALAEKARELGIACIIMSGDPEWVADRGVSPQDYIAKPFDLSDLLARVQAVLDRTAPVGLA